MIHPCHLQCWRVLFLLLFLTHIISLCHLSDVRASEASFNFLVFWSICLSSFLVYFRNGSKYLKRTTQEFILLMRLLQPLPSLVLRSFLIHQKYSFLIYFFFHLHLFDGVHFQYAQVLVVRLFSKFFLDLTILFLPLFVFFHIS